MSSLTLAGLGLLHLHLHLHAPGPRIDYIGVLLASAASWIGLPGPGEAVLIAASISAAHRHLGLALILLVAWAGATVGGTIGWIVGLKGGRGLLTARGPLHHLRLAVIARGDRFYARYGIVAVLFTPSWVAGIHEMKPSRYLPVNAVSAAIWAVAIGGGAYLVGPPILDVAADEGVATLAVVGVLVVIAVIVALRRRSRDSTPR